MIQGSGIPLQGSPHPHSRAAPALPGSYLWEIKRTMGEGKELKLGALVQDLLCSVGLRVRGTHSRMGSETCVKEAFERLLSASTQHCVPDSQVQATPHLSMCDGEGCCPPQENNTGHKKIYRPVRDLLHSFLNEGGQDSKGCHVAP